MVAAHCTAAAPLQAPTPDLATATSHFISATSFVHSWCREEVMIQKNNKTNWRIVWMGLLSLAICIVLASLQLMYLLQYFHHKKIL